MIKHKKLLNKKEPLGSFFASEIPELKSQSSCVIEIILYLEYSKVLTQMTYNIH